MRDSQTPMNRAEEVHLKLRRSGNSYAVTIPTVWVSEGGWNRGKVMRLRRYRPDSFVIDAPRSETSERFTLGAHDGDVHVFRELLGGFLQGHSDILLESDKKEGIPSRAVREFARRTGSMVVVSEDPGRVEFRDLGSVEIPIEGRIERMHSIAVEMHSNLSSRWSDLPFTHSFHLASRDDEVDRLGWQVRRALTRAGDHGDRFSAKEAIPLLLLSRTWERIADLAVHIEEEQEKLAGSPPPSSYMVHINNLHERALEMLSRGPEVLRGHNVLSANEYIDQVSAFEAERSALVLEAVRLTKSGKMAGECLPSVSVVLDALVRVARHLADVGELVMDTPAGVFSHPQQRSMNESEERKSPLPRKESRSASKRNSA